MRTDPFRDLDRLTQAFFGTTAQPAAMPMDAYRDAETFYIHLDLPGVDPGSIDLTVERNVLTVHAERRPALADDKERVVSERPFGVFSRQLFLGDTLDVDRMVADYDTGVLTIKIPVREQAKPRKVAVTGGRQRQEITS